MNTHLKTRMSSVLLHSPISFLPSNRITLLLNCVHHPLTSCMTAWCQDSSSGASPPRSLPQWQADSKMAPMGPTNWYLHLHVISFPWATTGPNDSLLFWEKCSNHDGMSLPELGYKKTLAAILLTLSCFSLLLTLMEGSQVSYFKLTYGEAHMAKKSERDPPFNKPKDLIPANSHINEFEIGPPPTKPWGDLKSLQTTWLQPCEKPRARGPSQATPRFVTHRNREMRFVVLNCDFWESFVKQQ